MKKGMLHHIELNVADLGDSRVFWDWLLTELGYKVFQEWSKGVSWKLKDTYIVLVQTEEKHRNSPYHRKETGLNHLAFYVENEEAVDMWTLKLKELNCTILYESQHPYAGGPDHYAVFFEDPNRIKLELVAGNKSRHEKELLEN